ncbi:MAG: response regulator [Fibromonadaceae bacterium]|jgi:PAS domain S-box-containing protein|nr:response regulator [Fibromonadaceae bacterium]
MREAKKSSILVVDDEINNILALMNILNQDYTVYAAKNGQDALEAAEKHLPDIILLDIIMPDMDGYAVITELRKSEKTKSIPVIFITGLSSPEDEEKGLAFEVADYIIKPFSPAIVKLRVKNQIKLIEQFCSNEYDIMKYKLSNDALKIALWDMDVIDGDPINPQNSFTWSQEFRQMLGFTDEIDFPNVLQSWSNQLHPEDKEHALEAFAAHINDRTGQTPYDIEYRLMLKNGDCRNFRAFGTTQRDRAGIPQRVAGAIEDMTEKKKAKEAAKRMSLRIEAIINNLPGMVYQCLNNPPEYTVTFISKGSKEFMGYEPEELIGKPSKYMEMMHPDDIEDIVNKIEKTLMVGLPYEHSNRAIMPDGTIKWIWERTNVLEWNPDGSPAVLEGYMFDVTDKWKLYEAEAANRAKSNFLAKMSHEIRTPMNSIMGFAELALDSDSMPQMNDYLRKIFDSTKWLLNIINDILDISKIEAGKMELEHVPFDLHEVFSRCQSVILPIVKEKNLDLSIYVEPSIGKKLLGDPVRLYQALMNLLSNAVKFTSSGKVKFSSAIKSTDANNTTVYFEIRDTGIGMTHEQIKKIFDPFVQADSSTTRDYGGTGLGLTIAKNIVELMGGELKVESALGAGSTFSFEVTFDTVEAANDTTEQKKLDMIEKPYFEGLVLICDDNSLNQQVICAHLARVGLQTVAADNGKIGVDIVRKRKENNEAPFDLIFMDMFMPVMDGMEAAAKIMAMETGTPIVAMTANVMLSELEKYKRHGMPDCLGKPFVSQELWHILLKYLEPISNEPANADIDEGSEEERKVMRFNFYKSNKNIHAEITEAVAAGDTKLAHRLAHTLKGNAGLLGKTELRNAALDVETLLKDGASSIWESKMNKLKAELTPVLEEFKILIDEAKQEKIQMMSTEQALALFEKLEPMLKQINPECIDLLGDIRTVQGAEELAQQIENYKFKEAAKILSDLKKQLGELGDKHG